ncbi:MAG: dihydrolipoyl dehydrogenase [Candidatus Marinimicrobia bacterium]|nr:dihydrolipoyl dehydrogenase [Candidatus Neomarinimicrobiota bacterium]
MESAYDVVVIGGGPGGYVAAIRAAQLGKSAVVVESNHLGGVCLNWGCIPTKALLRSAELYEQMQRAQEFGLKAGKIEVDWKAVVRRSRDVAGRLAKGIEMLLKKHSVTYIPGRGMLAGATEVKVTPHSGSAGSLSAGSIIIATGARPRQIAGMETDGKQVITAKDAMVLPKVPGKLIVVGAGAVGVEFAYLYSAFGSEVTLIEMQDAILPLEDHEISKELARTFKKRKIEILTGTVVERIDRQKSQVKVQLAGSAKNAISGDIVLMAAGVTGNVEELGLEAAGVAVDRGAIVVDDRCRTSLPGVYAIGDVIGAPWLAHVASAEGVLAAEAIAGLKPRPIDYGNIPGCTYSQPQVASVGLTERAAIEAGYEVKVGKFPFRALGKSLVSGEIDGFTKMVYDARHGELLGTHIIGDHATDLISEAAVARTLETTRHEIQGTVHPHPTLSESLMEASAMAYDEAVNI